MNFTTNRSSNLTDTILRLTAEVPIRGSIYSDEWNTHGVLIKTKYVWCNKYMYVMYIWILRKLKKGEQKINANWTDLCPVSFL